MTAIPDKYLDLLERKKAFAALATTMPDGSPQVIVQVRMPLMAAFVPASLCCVADASLAPTAMLLRENSHR